MRAAPTCIAGDPVAEVRELPTERAAQVFLLDQHQQMQADRHHHERRQAQTISAVALGLPFRMSPVCRIPNRWSPDRRLQPDQGPGQCFTIVGKLRVAAIVEPGSRLEPLLQLPCDLEQLHDAGSRRALAAAASLLAISRKNCPPLAAS